MICAHFTSDRALPSSSSPTGGWVTSPPFAPQFTLLAPTPFPPPASHPKPSLFHKSLRPGTVAEVLLLSLSKSYRVQVSWSHLRSGEVRFRSVGHVGSGPVRSGRSGQVAKTVANQFITLSLFQVAQLLPASLPTTCSRPGSTATTPSTPRAIGCQRNSTVYDMILHS